MTTVPAAAARTLNRAQIIDMGRQGTPWQFLPVACQALRQIPQDTELRFLTGANFARLRLKTAASEHLDRLPPDAAQAPEVLQLRAVLGQLPDDRVPFQERLATCRANLAALARRGIDLSTEFAAWAPLADTTEFFRAIDGNVVRRARGERDGAQWIHLSDCVGAARAFVQDHVAGKPEALARPLTLEGCDPPWLLRELHAALPRQKDGYWPPIRVVQRDAREFLDGLSLAAMPEELGSERLSAFVGEEAPGRFEAELASRDGTTSCGPILTTPGVRTRCEPGLEAITRTADGRQSKLVAELGRTAHDAYTGRTRSWWAERFAAALTGRGDALRVLIPTCRYSTFIQHASADLCHALRENGVEARTLIEPDDSSRFSSVAYLRAFADFQPDLVVLINYTRAHMNARSAPGSPGIIPANVPYVCWLQDAMPHQFDAEIGARCGSLDFLAGYLHEELFTKFGFPRDRSLAAPMVASETKFHPGPVDPPRQRRLSCDVAYVSHHSETPEAMHERLAHEARGDARIPRVFETLLPTVRELAARPEHHNLAGALYNATARALADHLGEEPSARTVTLVHKCYAVPLADRFLRHETLRWASEACAAHGWKLHVYGRGWESHPFFGQYAKGELTHDEDLRAAYACARVHLHASSSVQLHQRLIECVLSGGVMLSRLMQETLKAARTVAVRAAINRADPDIPAIEGTGAGFAVGDHPELMRLTSILQRLGLARIGSVLYPVDGVAYTRPRDYTPATVVDRAGDLLRDLAETCFASAEGLAELIGTYIESPSRRAGVSASISSRAKKTFTHKVFANRLLEFVRDGLAK